MGRVVRTQPPPPLLYLPGEVTQSVNGKNAPNFIAFFPWVIDKIMGQDPKVQAQVVPGNFPVFKEKGSHCFQMGDRVVVAPGFGVCFEDDLGNPLSQG